MQYFPKWDTYIIQAHLVPKNYQASLYNTFGAIFDHNPLFIRWDNSSASVI